MNTEIQST